MKITRASRPLSLLAFAVVASPSFAGDSGWYVGGSVGRADGDINEERMANTLTGGTATSVSADDETDPGFKVLTGYQFNRNLALEGSYFRFSEFDFTAMFPAGSLSGEMDVSGFNLGPVLTWPLTEKFSALGRAGAHYSEVDSSFSSTGAVATPSSREKHEWKYNFGVGFQYDLSRAVSLRAEAEHYRLDDVVDNKGDYGFFSVGLITRFGTDVPAPVAYVAPAPSPPPPPPPVAAAAPAPPPPPPAPTKVAFSADSLFDFNSAVVKPAGKQELDQLAANLRDTRYEVITVTGHTDRIGRPPFNLELSMRRAEAVKSYLSGASGIPPGKIMARGVGESEPVTKPGDCGNQMSHKVGSALIACLQPDRRVEVEVSGTQ